MPLPLPKKKKSKKKGIVNNQKKKSNKEEEKKLYFEETFVVNDSDSDADFKTPRPLWRKRISEGSKRKIEEEEEKRLRDSGEEEGEAELEIIQEIKGKYCDNKHEGTSTSSFSSLCVASSTSTSSSSTAESWKTLMGRMQTNQKLNGTNTNNNQSVVNQKRVEKKKQTKRRDNNNTKSEFLYQSSSTFLDIGCDHQKQKVEDLTETLTRESPPKKLKLELDETDSLSQPSSSISSSIATYYSTSTPTSSTSVESVIKKTKNRTKAIITVQELKEANLKVPDMFLKPSERAERPKANMECTNTTKVEIENELCETLKALSTEPEKYPSAEQARSNESFFDGNIVKLNDVGAENSLPNTGDKSKAKPKSCPFYKKIPGTTFTVDAFSYGTIPGIEVYFLSHFHSDHYVGLSKKFWKTIVCSPPTGNLVKLKLGVEDRCIRVLQVNTPYIVNSAEVTLVHANHCPGSVMFVFRLQTGSTILHTGDFRFTSDMLTHPIISGLNGKIDSVYLDTTYCDPQYDFPSQTQAIAELISFIKPKFESHPKTLIVCGSYVIGKERVYFSLAEALKVKVFLNYEKRRIINSLENTNYLSYLSPSEDQACIHVQQLFSITQQFLTEYLTARGKYTHIIGVKPSGWHFKPGGNGSGLSVRSYQNGTVTVIGVPYSEHSSFSELEQFVTSLKPVKVQPTVNVGNAAKREKMMQHINKWLSN